MTILLINQVHFRRGGADIVYLNTGSLLAQHGHHVIYFSTASDDNEPIGDQVFFSKTKDLRKVNLLEKTKSFNSYLYNNDVFKKLTKLIDKNKPDLAHVHLFHGSLSISVLDALHQADIPILHTVHDYKLLCPVNTFMNSKDEVCELCAENTAIQCIKNKCSDGNLAQSCVVALENILHRSIKKSSLHQIDQFHFVSEFALKKHVQYKPEIAQKSKVLYNFTHKQVTLEKQCEEKYFLYFGRLSKEKGIETLLESWSQIQTNYVLKIVGTGQLHTHLVEKVKRNKIANVDFVGYLTGESLQQMIHHAYFVIVPSEWYENNPMTIIESYSHHVPVIGANIGGIPEIIDENKTGYVFVPRSISDLKEKIIEATRLSDEDYLIMKTKAYSFFEDHFSEEIHYKKLMNLYRLTVRNKNTIN